MYNVIIYEPNYKAFIQYNVMPYFIECYRKEKKKPKTFNEFKKFIERNALYQFWSRCEYEIILSDWPPSNPPIEEKWDVYRQIMMNIDVITKILMEKVC